MFRPLLKRSGREPSSAARTWPVPSAPAARFPAPGALSASDVVRTTNASDSVVGDDFRTLSRPVAAAVPAS